MPADRTTGSDEQFQVPPIAVSPLTGATGSINWGGLNKFNLASRWVIADVEADDLINWLPQLSAFQQVPSPGPLIGTLPGGTLIWGYTDILNGNLYTFILSTNGTIYQMNTTGAFVVVGTGFSSQCDIANWQGTQMMITDPIQQKVFSWNGSTLTTVFTTQIAQFIAVYSNRVWLSNGLAITWTNANTNNSFAGDSGTYIITEGRCANPIIGMRDFAGSLYVFGSNWIKTIYNLNTVTVNNVATLSFQQPTIEAQIGTVSKWSIIEYGGMLFFANAFGFWSLQGAFPTKISNVLDGFFQGIDFANTSWSGCYGTILGMPCVLWQGRWNGDGNWTVFGYTLAQQWFRIIPVTGSGTGIVRWICGSVSSAVSNNIPITYYSDGTNFYNLFGGGAPVVSTFNTKFWDFNSKLTVDWFTNAALQMVINGPTTLTVCELNSTGVICGPGQPAACLTNTYNVTTGDWYNNQNVVGQWVNNTGVTGHWIGIAASYFLLAQYTVPFQERALALNITLTSMNAVFQSIIISYRKMSQAKG